MQDRDQHAAPSQAAFCLNCGARLPERWCSNCGQSDEARHRSVGHFLGELAEVLTHADSRLWRTLGRLAWTPGRLTRDYLEGRRISQLPPLRLVMIALFLLFTVASVLARPMHIPSIPAGDLAEVQHEIAEDAGDIKEARSDVGRSAHARAVDR